MFFKTMLYAISLFIFHFCLHKSASGNTKIFLPAHNKLLNCIPKGLGLSSLSFIWCKIASKGEHTPAQHIFSISLCNRHCLYIQYRYQPGHKNQAKNLTLKAMCAGNHLLEEHLTCSRPKEWSRHIKQ